MSSRRVTPALQGRNQPDKLLAIEEPLPAGRRVAPDRTLAGIIGAVFPGNGLSKHDRRDRHNGVGAPLLALGRNPAVQLRNIIGLDGADFKPPDGGQHVFIQHRLVLCCRTRRPAGESLLLEALHKLGDGGLGAFVLQITERIAAGIDHASQFGGAL